MRKVFTVGLLDSEGNYTVKLKLIDNVGQHPASSGDCLTAALSGLVGNKLKDKAGATYRVAKSDHAYLGLTQYLLEEPEDFGIIGHFFGEYLADQDAGGELDTEAAMYAAELLDRAEELYFDKEEWATICLTVVDLQELETV